MDTIVNKNLIYLERQNR